jgi:hypothetical protein
MEVFEVLPSIETHRCSGASVRDFLQTSVVILIFDHTQRMIFLWHGKSASLVRYFIGIQLVREYIKYFHGSYSSKEISEDSIENIPENAVADTSGTIQDLKNPHLIETDESNNAGANPSGTGLALQISFSPSNWRDQLTIQKLQVFENPNVNVVLDKLRQIPPIPGYSTEMLVVGNTVYAPTQELEGFFLERKEVEKFVKLGQLPEGWFFLPGYSCRLIIIENRLQALEYLRKTTIQSELGRIHAPVLPFVNPFQDQSVDSLTASFKIPEDPPFDEIIAKVHK